MSRMTSRTSDEGEIQALRTAGVIGLPWGNKSALILSMMIAGGEDMAGHRVQ